MERSRDPQEERKLRKIAIEFWFAVQRMGRRGQGPPPPLPPPPRDGNDDDDQLGSSGVPKRPIPSAGSASAAVPEPNEDPSP